MLDCLSGGRLVAGFPVGTSQDTSFAYGANPATNAWFTPLTIMDGRFVRFGLQMNF